MGNGGGTSPGIVVVFLCISSYSKTLSRRIIYTLFFTTCRRLLGASPLDPTGATLDPAGGLPTLICPHLKNPAGVHADEMCRYYHAGSGFVAMI